MNQYQYDIIPKDDNAVSEAIKAEEPEQKRSDPIKNGIKIGVLVGLLLTIISVVIAAIAPDKFWYASVFGMGLGTVFLFLLDRNYYKIFED